MTVNNFIIAEVAAFAHREAAHHGGMDNMIATALVLRNRQRAGWHGGAWMQILGDAAKAAAMIYPPSVPNLQDLTFRNFLYQVDDIVNGVSIDKMTDGALYYAELNLVTSEWFKSNILQKPADHPRVATVGNVSFFR